MQACSMEKVCVNENKQKYLLEQRTNCTAVPYFSRYPTKLSDAEFKYFVLFYNETNCEQNKFSMFGEVSWVS